MTDRVTPRAHAKLIAAAKETVVAAAIGWRDVDVEDPEAAQEAEDALANAVGALGELQAVTFKRGRPKTTTQVDEPTDAEQDFLLAVAAFHGETKVWPSIREVSERMGCSRARGFVLAARLIGKDQLVKEEGQVRLPMAGLLP